jgi:hypothetical protein
MIRRHSPIAHAAYFDLVASDAEPLQTSPAGGDEDM